LLEKLRASLDSRLLSAGKNLSRLGIPPTGWTILGLLFALFASLAYATGNLSGQVSGGVFILVSGLIDILDGAVARATGKITKRGAFLDSTLDRVGEVAIYAGIMIGSYTSPLWVLVAVTFSLLVSYTRARGEALGVKLSGVGIGERSERLLILALFSLAGFTEYGVVLVSAAAIITFLDRTRIAWKILSK